MKFSILGCGRWGSFVAWYLNKINNDVTIWGRAGHGTFENLAKTKKNEYVELSDKIHFTTDLENAITSCDFVVISISAQNVRSLMTDISKISGYENKKYILCMKGIEDHTGKRLSTILIDFGVKPENIAVWVGPGHIQSFTRGVPSVMLIDSYNGKLAEFLAKNLRSELIRFYKGNDIIGSEIGAAAKNVMGIAAGMLDGLNFSSLKGGLMARGTREVARLIKACGGNPQSAYGICHLGDYEATLFSPYSHNRMWGECFVKNIPYDKLAEGVATSSAMLKVAEDVGVELPITKIVNDFIQGKISKEVAIQKLLTRENLIEFND